MQYEKPDEYYILQGPAKTYLRLIFFRATEKYQVLFSSKSLKSDDKFHLFL